LALLSRVLCTLGVYCLGPVSECFGTPKSRLPVCPYKTDTFRAQQRRRGHRRYAYDSENGSPEKVTLTREATNVVPKKRVNDQEGGGGLFTVRTTFWLSQIPDDCLPILVPEGTIYYHCRLSARNYSYTWPYKTDTFLLQSRTPVTGNKLLTSSCRTWGNRTRFPGRGLVSARTRLRALVRTYREETVPSTAVHSRRRAVTRLREVARTCRDRSARPRQNRKLLK
jgi:hypothetical protein